MWSVAVDERERRVLSEKERRDAEAEFRAELEAEHARREAALARHKERRREAPDRDTEEARRVELYELREDVRQQFYKENGYKAYTDSTGREVWLPPAEYEQRMKRRRRRRRTAILEPVVADRHRTWLLYAALAVVALVLGFALAR